jgi:hypothetical protein
MFCSRRLLWACSLAILCAVAGCSREQGSQPQAKRPEPDHSEPEQKGIRSVRVLPDNPRGAVTLEAEALFWGPDPQKVQLAWLRDGERITGETSPTLPPSQFRKGDSISLEVEAEWEGGVRSSGTSKSVVIGNVAPTANRIEFQPRSPKTSDDLTAALRSCDFDGDELSYSYEWYVNGKRIPGNDGQTLSRTYFLRGDKVEVSTTPFDGRDTGETLRASVYIENSPPKIVSDVPALTGPGPYQYAVQANDPDGDVPQYRLEGLRPPGIELDSDRGIIQWDVPAVDAPRTYRFLLVAEDGKGGKDVQEVVLELHPSPESTTETRD